MRAIHHRGYDGFLRTEPAWRALAAQLQAPQFFHAYDWYAAFFAHLRPADEPIGVIELQDRERCVGLLPYHLRRTRAAGFPAWVLSLPDSPHLIVSDALLAPDLPARAAWRALRRCLARAHLPWHALCLGPVREDSNAMRFAHGLGRAALVRPRGGSRYFDATEAYAALSARFAGALRKNVRKGQRRLEQHGPVEFLCLKSGDARLPWAFERFLSLEASGWKGERGERSAIALSDGVRNFYRDLTTAPPESLAAEIRLLCVAGEPVAAQFATVCGSTRSVHKIAYDESFEHASPGTVLMAHTIEHSCQDPALTTLSLVTDMPWMRDWAAARAAVYDVWVPRNRALGALARAAVRVRQWLRPAPPAAAPPRS
jgi:CelD/BcsL family acetyltransferase involved in cellulose biosynthesis